MYLELVNKGIIRSGTRLILPKLSRIKYRYFQHKKIAKFININQIFSKTFNFLNLLFISLHLMYGSHAAPQ